MSSKPGNLESHLKQSRENPAYFVHKFFGAEPDPWQNEVLEALPHHPAIAIRSCNGPGKTALAAWIIYWFMTCFTSPKIPATAPTQHQLRDVLWSELAKWKERFLLKDFYALNKEKLFLKERPDEWFAVARTSNKKENLQGFHADNLLFVIDEASGIDEDIYEAIDGALTSEHARVLMLGNPTKNFGYFYDAFHKDRKIWWIKHVSAHDSPRVTREYIERMAQRWGKSSNIYRVRVEGEFPLTGDRALIPLHLVEYAMNRGEDGEPPDGERPRIVSCDPARYGDDFSAIALRQANKIIKLYKTEKESTMETTGRLVREGREFSADETRCDVGGIGAGIVDRLRELGIVTVEINYGAKAKNSADYDNAATEMYDNFRQLLERHYPVLPRNDELCGQLVTREYEILSNGRMRLESKEAMKERGLPSPDLADAVVQAYAESVRMARAFRRRPRGL